MPIHASRSVNEGMGLPAGDSILQTTTSRLSSCVKNGNSIARLSADSFGIILNQMTQADVADKICNRILAAIRQTFRRWLADQPACQHRHHPFSA